MSEPGAPSASGESGAGQPESDQSDQGTPEMLVRKVTIANRRGLHARASAKFVGAVAGLPEGTVVRVARDGNEAAGGSILGLMMLGAAKGDEIEIRTGGPAAQLAMTTLVTLVEDRFGED